MLFTIWVGYWLPPASATLSSASQTLREHVSIPAMCCDKEVSLICRGWAPMHVLNIHPYRHMKSDCWKQLSLHKFLDITYIGTTFIFFIISPSFKGESPNYESKWLNNVEEHKQHADDILIDIQPITREEKNGGEWHAATECNVITAKCNYDLTESSKSSKEKLPKRLLGWSVECDFCNVPTDM